MKKLVYFSLILICIVSFLILGGCLDNGESGNVPDEVLSTMTSDKNAPEIQWYQMLGRGFSAQGNSVEETSDGGYIICGRSDLQVFLIKTDSEGNKLWEKRFIRDTFGESVTQTSDGGYILCGDMDHQIALIKTDMEGNLLFDKTFNYYYQSNARDVYPTNDGGFIICGTCNKLTGRMIDRTKMLIIKTDSDGNELWHKIFGGENYGYGCSIWQTQDGGYILGGSGNPDDMNHEGVWLIKTDENGNELWNNLSYYGVGTGADITGDGGYIACGYTIDWSIQAWLVKVDRMGNRQWDIKFKGDSATGVWSVQQTSDGGYIACGRINSPEKNIFNILLLKIAPEK